MSSVSSEENKFIDTLLRSPLFQDFFNRADGLQLQNWYVAGGCVTQTIWNGLSKRPWLHGLKDIDLIYFDSSLNPEDQKELEAEAANLFQGLALPIDLQNEAQVHTWYAKKFGYEIEPYQSAEEGIMTWLPAFAVGIRKEGASFHVFAPNGLDDLFSMTVRPNKKQITEEIYSKMVARLQKDWPEISVLPWD